MTSLNLWLFGFVVYITQNLKVIYLIGFVGTWHKDTPFSPAIALVTTDRPQEDVNRSFLCLFALFYMQHANVWPKHVVPKRHTQVRILRADYRTHKPSHFSLLETSS